MNSNIKFLGVDSTKVDLTEKKDAINNAVTEYYTAEEIARPYKVYKALLSQESDDAPTAVVLENTLGDIVWSREDVGFYVGTLNNSFTENKTFFYATLGEQAGDSISIAILRVNNSEVYLLSKDGNNDFKEIGSICSIEIQVYP
jgi:hypothetical protein